MLSSAFDDFEIIVDDLMIDGDRVGVRARMRGIHVGALFGVEARKTRFEIALHEFHELRNGRIARTHRGRYINLERAPASTLLGVSALFLPGVLVEVEAVASFSR